MAFTLLMTFAQAPSIAQPTGSAPSAVTTQLADLNTSFISLYRAQTPSVKAELPLIIIMGVDGVTAIEPTQKTRYAFSPGINEIKSALHAVLAYQGVMTELSQPNSTLAWTEADRFLTSLVALTSLIPKTQVNALTQKQTTAFIWQLKQATRLAIDRQTKSPQEVAATLKLVEPQVMAVVNALGELSATAMTAALEAIKDRVTPAVWEAVIIVVPGPATARMNNLGLAVAARVLGESALGRQIFYSEAIYDDESVLNFVQMLMRDKRFSTLMFDQPYRMWRDVLADTSLNYLDKDTVARLAR